MHMAPPPCHVVPLIKNSFNWVQPLFASTTFHYEFEFIHPFSDGNGRMGRLWQTLILSSWQLLLAYLPVETVIKSRQQDYYRLLGEADKQADCPAFIEFLLQSIQESLHEAITSQNSPETRVETSKVKTEDRTLEILEIHPELSLAEVATTIGRSVSAVERAVTKLKSQNRWRTRDQKRMANGRFCAEVTSILFSVEINSRCSDASAFLFADHKK